MVGELNGVISFRRRKIRAGYVRKGSSGQKILRSEMRPLALGTTKVVKFTLPFTMGDVSFHWTNCFKCAKDSDSLLFAHCESQ